MSRPPLAAKPDGLVPVPRALAERYPGVGLEPIWRNEAGGITFRMTPAGEPGSVVKWNPVRTGIRLAEEAERMRWLAARHPAPHVLELGRGADDDGDDAEWLVTRALDAVSAVDVAGRAQPERAVLAIARGLRRLHALPATDCPFVHEPEQGWGRVRSELGDPPEPDAPLVVLHGDPCAPNTLIDERGGFAAHVDLGRLGVGDRWADLAVASMALGWNYGEGLEPLFFAEYRVDPDPERIQYWRAVWDLPV